jgi:hypothetical protein
MQIPKQIPQYFKEGQNPFGENNRKYKLNPDIITAITFEIGDDVQQFLNGKYLNIEQVKRKALEIINSYPPGSKVSHYLKQIKWSLETDEQRVERRSSMVRDFFTEVGENFEKEGRKPTIYFDYKKIPRSSSPEGLPSDEYYQENTSPISVVDSARITQESRSTSPSPPSVPQSKATFLSKEEIKDEIAELAEEIYAFNQNLLKILKSSDVNAQLHVSDMAEKKLRDISRYMERLSRFQYFIIFDELIKRKEYTQLVRFTGKKI